LVAFSCEAFAADAFFSKRVERIDVPFVVGWPEPGCPVPVTFVRDG
jgi:hypothetical protein